LSGFDTQAALTREDGAVAQVMLEIDSWRRLDAGANEGAGEDGF
jgi:hypothetical protein